tara:strand:- start:48 stop:428 length:381 start_codon:yes stop_codon:yes gene_type:complete
MSKQAMNEMVKTYEHPVIIRVVEAMKNAMEYFSAGDHEWIMNNQAVVVEFFNIADEERLAKNQSGSWLIANQVRWRTRTRENKGLYKLNNNHISLLAHAYNHTGESRAKYFKVKRRTPLLLEKGDE